MSEGKPINHKALIDEMAGHLDHFNADTFQGSVLNFTEKSLFSVIQNQSDFFGNFPLICFSKPCRTRTIAKDLERLITQATNDLKEYDVERHEKFKEYEMQKALEEELKMKDMNELEKKAYQQEEIKRKTAHKKQAQNLPHPVSF